MLFDVLHIKPNLMKRDEVTDSLPQIAISAGVHVACASFYYVAFSRLYVHSNIS